MNKLNKYIKKIQRNPKPYYLQKVAYYLINNNQIDGHSLRGGGPLKIHDKENIINDLVNFLKEKYENTKPTINKYLVILYGPPASGKSAARKIACNIIHHYFESNIDVKDINSSFIDTSVDDIVEIIEKKDNGENISGKDKLIKNIKDTITNWDTLLPEKKIEEIKAHIKIIAEKGWKTYSSYREKANAVSELLYYFSIFLDRNIYFETASGDVKYMRKLISIITYYKYIPIFIYPFVKDVKTLYNRVIKRGIENGRFLQCEKFGLVEKMKECSENYKGMKNILRNIDDNVSKQYFIYQYRELDVMDFDNLNNKFEFPPSIFNKYLLNMEHNLEKEKEIDNETFSRSKYEIVIQTNKDYSTLTTLKLDCPPTL